MHPWPPPHPDTRRASGDRRFSPPALTGHHGWVLEGVSRLQVCNDHHEINPKPGIILGGDIERGLLDFLMAGQRKRSLVASTGLRSPLLKALVISARFTTSTVQLTGRAVNLAEDNWHPIGGVVVSSSGLEQG